MQLKNIIMAIVASFIVASCGNPSGTLEERKKELQVLKKEIGKLQTKAKQLEAEIQDLDTLNDTKGIAVRIDTIELKAFRNPFQFQGLVVSEDEVNMSSETGGLITNISIREGQQVQAGQILVSLDASLVRAQIAELEKAMELTQTAYERQKNLWDQKIGSEIQYIQAKNNKESMERRLQTAKVQLDKFNLRSPVSGMVDAVFLKKGDMTAPGMPVLRVVSTKNIKIKADVSEQYISVLKPGDEVDVFFPSLKRGHADRISATGAFINPNNRTFSVYVNPSSNMSRELKPNMLVMLTAYDYAKDQVIAIPTRLIRNDQEGSYVYVAEGASGKKYSVERRYLEIEQSFATETVVSSGLKEGDLLITEGYQKVIPGDQVFFIQ